MGRPPRGAGNGSGWGQGSEAQGLPPLQCRGKVPAAPVLAGQDGGDRGPQKIREGRQTKSQSRTEAKSGRDREQVRWRGSGRELTVTRQKPWLGPTEIPVASDGRVGSGLRAIGVAVAQHGASGLGGQWGPCLHAQFSRGSPPLESEAAQGGRCCADWALEPWGAVGWQRVPHCLGELGAGPGKAGK